MANPAEWAVGRALMRGQQVKPPGPHGLVELADMLDCRTQVVFVFIVRFVFAAVL